MARGVLIVDDIPFVRKTIGNILSEAHYQIVGEAENGNAAIELFAKTRPDIVLMDVVMPDLNGIEATRRILKIDKEAKIVIVSAMDQEGLIMEAINAGARDYILKPFTPENLLRSVEHALLGEENAGDRQVI